MLLTAVNNNKKESPVEAVVVWIMIYMAEQKFGSPCPLLKILWGCTSAGMYSKLGK